MLLYNEKAERDGLSMLLDRSRAWLKQINTAIDDYNKKSDQEKAHAEEALLQAALEVFQFVCEYQLPLDFMSKEPEGVRHTVALLSKSREAYVMELDAAQEPNAARETDGEARLSAEETDKEKKLPALSIGKSLPPNADRDQRSAYKARALRLLEIKPMYEVIVFAMDVVKQIRQHLNTYEPKGEKINGREWHPLNTWKEAKNKEKALETCRRICREALEQRKGKPFRLFAPPVPLNKNRQLDVFDNEYSVLSEMANADTTDSREDRSSVAIPTTLLRGWMCPHMKGMPGPEAVLLAAYIWARYEEMGLAAPEQRTGEWVSIATGAKAFGIYGDKRVAASGFLDALEKNQRAENDQQILKTLHIGDAVEVRLTRRALDAFEGYSHAVSPCDLVAAILQRSILKNKNAAEGQDGQDKTPKAFVIRTDADPAQTTDSDAQMQSDAVEIRIESKLWKAACQERERQDSLEFHHNNRVSLTKSWTRRFQEYHAAFYMGQSGGGASGLIAWKLFAGGAEEPLEVEQIEGEDISVNVQAQKISIPKVIWQAVLLENSRNGKKNKLPGILRIEKKDQTDYVEILLSKKAQLELCRKDMGISLKAESSQETQEASPEAQDSRETQEASPEAQDSRETQGEQDGQHAGDDPDADFEMSVHAIASGETVLFAGAADCLQILREKKRIIPHLAGLTGMFYKEQDADKLTTCFLWLDKTEIEDRGNALYQVLSALMQNPQKRITHEERLVGRLLTGKEISDPEQYKTAVRCLAKRAGAFMTHVVDFDVEMLPDYQGKYHPACLRCEKVKPVEIKDFWMTKAMRVVMAYVYKDKEMSKPFLQPKASDQPLEDLLLLEPDMNQEAVRELMDSICQRFAGRTWEELDDRKKDKDSRTQDERAKLNSLWADFNAFCEGLHQASCKIAAVPQEIKHQDGVQKAFSIYVYHQHSGITKEVEASLAQNLELPEKAPLWMAKEEAGAEILREAKRIWINRICDDMRKSAKQDKPERTCSVLGESNLLSFVLAAAMQKAKKTPSKKAKKGKEPDSEILEVKTGRLDGGHFFSDFSIDVDGEAWEFKKLCSWVAEVGKDETKYKAFREYLQGYENIRLKTKDWGAEKVTWEIKAKRKKENAEIIENA